MNKLVLLYTNALNNSETLERILIITIFTFLALTIVLFSTIMIYRTIKIADSKYISGLKNTYGDVFMGAAFSTPEELNTQIKKTIDLNKEHLTKKRYAQIITDELLFLYNSFTGESKKNLKDLYIKAGFIDYSEKKVKSNKWEIQARGIREVAQMKDERVIGFLKTLTNHKNQLVKENAQLSLVKINGFDGLNFLNDVNTPISDWQQVNLLGALKEHGNQQIPDFTSWLSSSEKTVILFAIRLMNHYKQIEGSNKLLTFLNYRDKKLKTESIRTLVNLGKTEAIPYFENIYHNESHEIKIELIKAYSSLITNRENNKLSDWLIYTKDPRIQKECLEAIISLDAIEILRSVNTKDIQLANQIAHILKPKAVN